jgi:hypothetical protein
MSGLFSQAGGMGALGALGLSSDFELIIEENARRFKRFDGIGYEREGSAMKERGRL